MLARAQNILKECKNRWAYAYGLLVWESVLVWGCWESLFGSQPHFGLFCDGWPYVCISAGAHVSCWHAPKTCHIALKIAGHMRMGYWFEEMYWLGGVGSLCSAPNLISDCFRGCDHPPTHPRTH